MTELQKENGAKERIAHAYLDLLRKQAPDEISVTAITGAAKASRMAFYRNFTSKQAIVEFYLGEVLWREMLKDEQDPPDFGTPEYGLRFFQTMENNRELILLLERRGYASLILQTFNAVNEYLAGDMPQSSIERYRLYYIAGAAFNAMLVWIRDGCKESAKAMAENLRRYVEMF